jgi:hypothetical protein
VEAHPDVRGIRLVGSRATGTARPGSDWDFAVATADFDAVAAALPTLLASLDPLAAQWDRLGDTWCWMLILRGPVKVDLIFEEPHVHEPPWQPSAENLEALDAHFWDWTLWLHAKEAAGKRKQVSEELRKLSEHLLRPLGVEAVPASVVDAVDRYRPVRDALERRFGRSVPRALEAEVAPVVGRSPRW